MAFTRKLSCLIYIYLNWFLCMLVFLTSPNPHCPCHVEVELFQQMLSSWNVNWSWFIKCHILFVVLLWVQFSLLHFVIVASRGYSLHSLFSKLCFLHSATVLSCAYLYSQFSSVSPVRNLVWNYFSLAIYISNLSDCFRMFFLKSSPRLCIK